MRVQSIFSRLLKLKFVLKMETNTKLSKQRRRPILLKWLHNYLVLK